MIDALLGTLDAAYAFRWWLTAAAFLILGGFFAESLCENRRLRRKMEARDRTIRILRSLARTQRRRAQLIVGRVRS